MNSKPLVNIFQPRIWRVFRNAESTTEKYKYTRDTKYTEHHWNTPMVLRRSDTVGSTKPLLVVVGYIEKDFDVEEVLREVKDRIEKVRQKENEEEVQQNFIDPSIIPMRISKFCRILDLSNEAKVVLNSYKKPENHFTYPIEAMLRVLFYQRLSRIKHYTTLESKLKDEGIARDLEFKEKDGKISTPAERSLNRFVNERLGNKNLKAIQTSFIGRLKEGLAKEGIKLGRGISIDSTPLPTLKNDECGKYNAYLRSSSSHHSDNF